jgi:hypothetical protein
MLAIAAKENNQKERRSLLDWWFLEKPVWWCLSVQTLPASLRGRDDRLRTFAANTTDYKEMGS